MKRPLFHLALTVCLAALTPVIQAQSSSPASAAVGNEYYGVIELGAKGIKPLVVQAGALGPDGVRQLPHVVKPDPHNKQADMDKPYAVVNKNPYDGAATVNNVVAEVTRLRELMMKDFHMPAEQIYVVESSGLLKEPKEALHDKLPDNTPIYEMPSNKESEFVFKGIVPGKRMGLNEVVVLDIGSGNSKGAYLTQNTPPLSFDTFNVPLGTGTFAKLIKGEQKNGDNFMSVALSVTADKLLPPLRAEVRNNPGMQNCTRLYLAGGLPYVMSTLLHPDQVVKKDRDDHSGTKNSDWMDLSAADIDKFYEIATTDPASLLKPDLSKIAAADRAEVEKEVNNAIKIFNQDELAAGAILLKTFMDEMNGSRKTKIAFSRAALYAWPQGFVADMIAKHF